MGIIIPMKCYLEYELFLIHIRIVLFSYITEHVIWVEFSQKLRRGKRFKIWKFFLQLVVAEWYLHITVQADWVLDPVNMVKI